jgi:lysophospholipase L1-like esterase
MAMIIGTVTFLAWGGSGIGGDAAGRDATTGRDNVDGTRSDGGTRLDEASVGGALPAATSDARSALPPLAAALSLIPATRSDSLAKRPVVVLPDLQPIVVSRVGRGSRAIFLGDSYTSGLNGAGLGARGWPALVGAARGWKVVNLSVPGTGFMNPGWTAQPIGSRVDVAIRQKPDVVFVAAGHNDSRWSAATTSMAADRVIDRLHAALPDTVIVIVAPIWQNASPPTRCLILRDELWRKARSLRDVFIDPLAERWFTGTSHRFIGPDELHPTNAGHAYIADRILADMTGI